MTATLEGNIRKYNILKIFTKRVFLPLITIHLVTIGGVTLVQLGIIASASAITQIVLEVPLGYFADRFGHKRALALGSFITAISVLPYLFMPNFLGGLLASIGFFAGWGFMSGTTQAFMHDTLAALGREGEYAKIMGRAQSYGLLGNVALVSLVPLLYPVNHNLPFIVGFVCLLISFFIILSFKEPPQASAVEPAKEGVLAELKAALPRERIAKLLIVFLIFGIVSASFDQASNYRELIFGTLGIPASYFGFILAFGSLLAAVAGRHVHRLKRLDSFHFYLFDAAYVAFVLLIIGISHDPIITVLAFSLLPAYDRTRNIIYESQLFEALPSIRHKSTIISVMNFFDLGNSVWIPLVLAWLIHQTGLISGHLYFGIGLIVLVLPLIFVYKRLARKSVTA